MLLHPVHDPEVFVDLSLRLLLHHIKIRHEQMQDSLNRAVLGELIPYQIQWGRIHGYFLRIIIGCQSRNTISQSL